MDWNYREMGEWTEEKRKGVCFPSGSLVVRSLGGVGRFEIDGS